MSYNKIIFDGHPLIDLTNDTVNPEALKKGYTAHNAAGDVIIGVMEASSSDDYLSEPVEIDINNATSTIVERNTARVVTTKISFGSTSDTITSVIVPVEGTKKYTRTTTITRSGNTDRIRTTLVESNK